MEMCPYCEKLIKERSDVCPLCGNIIRLHSESTSEKLRWDRVSQHPNQQTIFGYGIGALGVLIGLWGLQSLLVDSNALGLYFGMCPAAVLIVVAWGLSRA
jgi:hypothetical protein